MPMSFEGKKFVIIASGEIASRSLAMVGVLVGFQFGRKVPDMIGRDQQVPKKVLEGQPPQLRTHHGITTRNLPVLNGLGFDNMRTVLEALKRDGGEGLLITEVTEAMATANTYAEYAEVVARTPEAETNYWGIGVFGDEAIINKHTAGLKLYSKQPAIPNTDAIAYRKRLGDDIGLPSFRYTLANNLSGGVMVNSAVILAATHGKLYGDTLFGPDIFTQSGRRIPGLPIVDFSVLSGGSAKDIAMRTHREKLHSEPSICTVDVTDATATTRNYEDYLHLAETTAVEDTVYQGVGIAGVAQLVNDFTSGFGPYITSAEEQDSQKKAKGSGKKPGGGASSGGSPSPLSSSSAPASPTPVSSGASSSASISFFSEGSSAPASVSAPAAPADWEQAESWLESAASWHLLRAKNQKKAKAATTKCSGDVSDPADMRSTVPTNA
jgi:hypothetical protein